MTKKKKEVELWCAVFDLHYPQYDKPTFNAIMDFLRQNPVDGFIFGGDQEDNAEISHHNRRKPLHKLPGSYKKNTEGFDQNILRVIESALPKGCEKVWVEGNHDHWEYELVESQPELEGTIERPLLLNLEARGWKLVEMGLTFQKGELAFAHGEALSGCGNQSPAMHARKALEVYCQNIVYGHYHNPMSYSKILPTDQKRKWMSWCMPIVGSVNPKYLENRPTAWLNGFGIIEFRGKGLFNVYPVIIIDGKFSFAGKIYGGK